MSSRTVSVKLSGPGINQRVLDAHVAAMVEAADEIELEPGESIRVSDAGEIGTPEETAARIRKLVKMVRK